MTVFKRMVGLAMLLLLVGAIALAVDAARFFFNPLPNEQGKLIAVDPGMSFRAIAGRLADEGVIAKPRDVRYLSLYARATDQAHRIKSGEYVVPAGQTPAHVVALLVSGNTRQYRLTLVEGRRFSDIRRRLADNDALKHTLAGKSDAEVMAALGHPDEAPEGRFMPDTYLFPRGMTDLAFLERAYAAMATFLEQAWAERADDAMVDTPYEALILASIIEKETAVPAERRRIAGVFSRRLEKEAKKIKGDPVDAFLETGIERGGCNIQLQLVGTYLMNRLSDRTPWPVGPVCEDTKTPAMRRQSLHVKHS